MICQPVKMGRTTGISYTGGGSDSMSYTPEGWLSSLSNASFTNDTLGNSTSWSDGTNSATFSYTGTYGSKRLGLPSSISGSGDTGSYSFTYLANHWMRTLTDSGKNKTFTFDYNTDSTLAQLQYPNQTVLSQTWGNKMLDEVKVTKGEDTYLESDATFNEDDQLTAFETEVYAGQNTTFSESNTLEYDSSHRLSELSYGSSSKTLTYSYDSSVGLLSSILDSELDDTYDFSYDSKGRLSTVGYPDSQNSATYTYNDSTGQGRLEEITYPNDRSMTLTWDGRDRITQIDLDDDGTVTTYALSFTDLNQIKRILKSEGGLALYSWNFSYGPLGLEKGVVKDPYNQTLLTQDYTVSANGTILSMSYTPTGLGGTFVGELYVAYDPCGNLALMTDASGDPQVSYAYDRGTTGITDVYNPGGIENLFTIAGKQGQITLPGFGDDWITLPIQRPGQIAVIGNNGMTGSGWINDTTSTGSTTSVTGPCDEVGTCDVKERSKENYHNCVANCFATNGASTSPIKNDDNEKMWNCWKSARDSWNRAAGILKGLGISISLGVAAVIVYVGLEITVTKGALTLLLGLAEWIYGALTAAAIGTLISESINWYNKMEEGNLWTHSRNIWDWQKTMDELNQREKDCREDCEEYRPLP
jgi:YD repeat-containing protein